jgi:hypothetical protein
MWRCLLRVLCPVSRPVTTLDKRVGIHALVWGERRLLTKMETMLKNSYAFSNVVVKFCEIFTCPVCEEHEIKNRKHYFLIVSCKYKWLWNDLNSVSECSYPLTYAVVAYQRVIENYMSYNFYYAFGFGALNFHINYVLTLLTSSLWSLIVFFFCFRQFHCFFHLHWENWFKYLMWNDVNVKFPYVRIT